MASSWPWQKVLFQEDYCLEQTPLQQKPALSGVRANSYRSKSSHLRKYFAAHLGEFGISSIRNLSVHCQQNYLLSRLACLEASFWQFLQACTHRSRPCRSCWFFSFDCVGLILPIVDKKARPVCF